MTGTAGQLRVPSDLLKNLEIPLAPLNEQKRIVAKLDELLPKVEACKERLQKIPLILKRFRQSVLAAAVSGRLTEEWRKGQSIEDAGWQSKRLSEICKVQTGATPYRKNPSYWTNGTIPWIKTGEVQNCDITSAEEMITELAIRETNAKVFPAGTILIAMYGEGKTRGQVGTMRIAAATNQACAALVFAEDDDILREYIYLYCLSQYQNLRSQSVGGNQPNLSLGIIKEWEVLIPQRDELKEIVARCKALLKDVDSFTERFSKARMFSERITDAILSKAFSGTLVPQDPTDEPASELLERIKQTSDNHTNGTGKRKPRSSNRKKTGSKLDKSESVKPLETTV